MTIPQLMAAILQAKAYNDHSTAYGCHFTSKWRPLVNLKHFGD
jgi:hypothetical protein